ncbi:MAG: GyrI-like domain-containing protein [Planctomycetota bacterium]|jgi:AraC family transcriptional regulator
MAEIQVKEVEPMSVMSLAFTGSYEQTQDKLGTLASWLLRVGHPYSSSPLGLYYDNPAEVAQEELRAEACLPIAEECEAGDDTERKELPGATVAFAVHKGPYSQLRQLYEELFNWIRENGYRYVEGQPTRELFLKMYGEVDDPEEFVTEVQVPVEKC